MMAADMVQLLPDKGADAYAETPDGATRASRRQWRSGY